MGNWLASHSGLIYQLQGMAFLGLGLVALILPRRGGLYLIGPHLWLLAVFAISHGLAVLLSWEVARQPGATGLAWLQNLVLLVSYVFLLEFGRRILASQSGRWFWQPLPTLLVPAALFVLALSIATTYPAAIGASARLGIGLPAALLAAWAFFSISKARPVRTPLAPHAPWLRVGALALAVYGLLIPVLNQPVPGLPQWIPTEADVLAATGLPVRVGRLLTTLTLLFVIVGLTREVHASSNEDLERLIETVNGFIYRCDNTPTWPVRYLSGNFEAMTRVSATELLQGRDKNGNPLTLDDLVHPDDKEQAWNTVQDALRERRDYQVEYRLAPNLTEEERWFYDLGRGVFDTKGNLRFLEGHTVEITQLRRADRSLKRANARLEQAERLARLGHWEVQGDGGKVYWSPQMYRLLGFDPAHGVPSREQWLLHIHPEDRGLMEEDLALADQMVAPPSRLIRTNPDHATQRYLSASATASANVESKVQAISGTLLDVTELHQALDDLRHTEYQHRLARDAAQREQGRLKALLAGMSIGILFEDVKGRVEYVNPAFYQMWAINEEHDLTGRPSREVLDHSTHRFARPHHASRHVLQVLDTHEVSERFEVDLHDGRILTQLSYPVTDIQSRPIGRLWIYEDVTYERQTAQQLAYLAEHDPLTGLRNRHRFQEELDRIIRTSLRLDSRFALLYFDLDDFKHINDNYGHSSGDTVLVRTAGEIASVVRGGDTFARLGGDEFAILTEIAVDEETEQLAERLIRTIATIPFRFRGNNLRLTASIGIAIFPTHGVEAEDLVARADAAMYQAKARGKNTWAVYNPDQDDSDAILQRMSWSHRIAVALEQGLFELHFQGVYRAADCSLRHVEALVRMRDASNPDILLMPGQFIPVAEKTGQILAIDRWVVGAAVKLLAERPHVPAIAVNLSGRSVDDPKLPRFIAEALKESGVVPGRLVVELTETAAVTEMQDAQRLIEQLQRAGCVVCLDDFGSGFATFGYLKYLAVDILKIDGMFIRDLAKNPENQVFVRAIIDVARGLGKETVAEFVEDAMSLDMLRDLKVDLVQGYHLDRPSPDHPALRPVTD